MTITCTVCGTVNPEGTQYCEGCGVELSAPATAAQTAAQTASQTPAASVLSAPAGAGNSPVDHIHIGGATPEGMAATAGTDTGSMGLSNTGPGAPLADGDITPPVESAMNTAPTADATLDTGLPDMPLPETGSATTGAPQAAADGTSTPAADMPMQESVTPAAGSTSPAEASSDTAAPVVAAPVSPAPADGATGAAKLGIKKYGAATGEFIPLQGERLVVGRFDASSGPVDIDLSGLGGQEHISRRHAELYRENGAWTVRDLGSTNGVYLKRAGEAAFSPRIQEPTALTDGDEIAFGNLMLSFHQG